MDYLDVRVGDVSERRKSVLYCYLPANPDNEIDERSYTKRLIENLLPSVGRVDCNNQKHKYEYKAHLIALRKYF